MTRTAIYTISRVVDIDSGTISRDIEPRSVIFFQLILLKAPRILESS